MKYCNQCGKPVALRVPPGETLLRFVCEACQTIHYQNPKIVVGCIPEWEDKILLCRRAIEPRLGLWTFPAGFMELDETTEQAAARETLEEAKAEVVITSLYAVFSLVRVNQVYVVFRGQMPSPDFGVGHESSDVELLSHAKIPWESLAFPVIHETLKRYVEDAGRGRFDVHFGVVLPMRS